MYLIAAVVAVVGAVVAFFTAGAAGAVVGLVIAAIMISPLGDKITQGLVTAFLGNNTNPTDAQKTGAQIGATAVVTVIATLLSMGAGGITTGAEAGGEGLADGVEASASVSSSVINSSEGLAVEMTEMGSNAGLTMTRQMAEEAEEAEALVSDIEDEISSSSDASDSDSTSSSSKGSKKFKLGFDKKALTTGLGKRLTGNLIIGFLGSGGLSEIMELISESNPAMKKWLDSDVGAVVMAIATALVAFAGTAVSSKFLSGPGDEERASYLKYSGKEDTSLTLSNTSRTILDVISFLAQAGNAVAGYVKSNQYKDLAATKELLANVDAMLVGQGNSLQTMNTVQDSMNKGYSADEKNLTSALKEVFDALGADENKTARAMS